MDILAALRGEHGPLRHMLEVLRLAAPRFTPAELRVAALLTAEAIESHAGLEDELLFRALVDSGRLPPGPVETMRAEHSRIESLLGQLLAPEDTPGRPASDRTLALLVETVHHHFAHEEQVLFRMADEFLPAEILESLADRWAERRSVTLPPRLAASGRGREA
ncbi:MAG: hemerythrin domain-containing protein [Thermoanaerobaculia bacterium]